MHGFTGKPADSDSCEILIPAGVLYPTTLANHSKSDQNVSKQVWNVFPNKRKLKCMVSEVNQPTWIHAKS